MGQIRDVWAQNLDAEMKNIRNLIDTYPYVAMDTEFPGVVARPIGQWKSTSEYHYQTLRCNVDLLKIIQVGLTLADEEGNMPPEPSTWQFNFRFSINEDMYSPDSIELLRKSGIDFQRHEEQGINPNDFAELMITSGLVLSPDTTWISFHSGYDFGYFVKLLTAVSLPTTEDTFFELLRIWFPTVYDIKVMMRRCEKLKGGLSELAEDLSIARVGPSHQAGSDSLLTASVYFKMREFYFEEPIYNPERQHEEYSGMLYGLGQTFSATNGIADPGRGGATIAEREDRTVTRERSQTPAPGPGQGVGMGQGMLGMGGGMGMPTPGYGPLSNGPYMRTQMVGGGR
ncbi:ribonuclease H-like domain-containing protein [Schizophyllum amplum]|uniref:poly(A)-specific ribonuclease n=1 Tax=Schizophyllum amplum TaxID=97359 RepID=A0A550CH94_9AGAR|nr:ribonuclease H-like domain-containing protein [Auriculariopsis ampla]TRM64178.1 ribonuclease H-like domain-containing protein [Auriculariopsis ampla]